MNPNIYYTYKGERLSFEEIQRRVLRSPKFRSWKRRTGLRKKAVYLEEHYTPKWWGHKWAYSAEQIRKLFRKEKGVLKLSNPKDDVRAYESMRVPASVAERVYRQIAGVDQAAEIFYMEQHYPPAYWAKKWGLSSKTVRALMRTFNQLFQRLASRRIVLLMAGNT